MHARQTAAAVAVATVLIVGLLAPSADARHHHGKYRVELLCEGRICPEATRRGDRWVMGQYGDRYTIRIHNDSNRRVEAVITVDGRDVVNGGSGTYSNRGYIVGAYDSIDIDGWRVSLDQVAAFRFTSVPDSYAGRVDGGRNAGVIGVAFFPERKRPAVRRPVRPVEPFYGGGGVWDDEDGAPRKTADAPRASRKRSSGEAEAAPSADSAGRRGYGKRKQARQGLGTRYGEHRYSSVTEVDFVRARSRPKRVVTLRYDDRSGLIARGITPPRPAWTPPPQRVSDRFVPPPPDPFPGRW